MQRAAHARGLRLVTFSRPGYGASTRQPGRRVVAAATDVAAVLAYLGTPRCLVAGWSGGGPHALATGARLPEQVAGVLCIASLAPVDAHGVNTPDGAGSENGEQTGLALPSEEGVRLRREADAVGLRQTDATGLTMHGAALLPDVDRAVLTTEFGQDLAATMAEGLRTGVDGWVDDDLAFAAPWGFGLAEIAVPTFVWHGNEDLMVPFAHGQWLSTQIPGARARLQQGEGHLSIGVAGLDRMFDDLLTTVKEREPRAGRTDLG